MSGDSDSFDALAQAVDLMNAALVLVTQYRCPPTALAGGKSRWQLTEPAAWRWEAVLLDAEEGLREFLLFSEVAPDGRLLGGEALLLIKISPAGALRGRGVRERTRHVASVQVPRECRRVTGHPQRRSGGWP